MVGFLRSFYVLVGPARVLSYTPLLLSLFMNDLMAFMEVRFPLSELAITVSVGCYLLMMCSNYTLVLC